MGDTKLTFSTVSVAVVCMAGLQHLQRCLTSLRSQRGAPAFEVVAVCPPHLLDLSAARQQFPEVHIVINEGQRTPLELASRAVRECSGELILITKDYCVPSADWVQTMVEAQRAGRAVVGGRVEIPADASGTDWAFYFVDFFRYAAPVAEGPASALTVCNVAYKRSELATIRDLWEETFVETAINEALRARFGSLWLTPSSEVTMCRPVTLRTAVYERYAFGRLFGYSRIARCSFVRRLMYALFAPGLPFLMLGRMAGVALRSRQHTRAFLRSLAPLVIIVLARCWGEWLAYLTGHDRRSLDSLSAPSSGAKTNE